MLLWLRPSPLFFANQFLFLKKKRKKTRGRNRRTRAFWLIPIVECLIWLHTWTVCWKLVKCVGPLIRRHIFPLQVPPLCPALMKGSKWTCCSWMISLRRMQWMFFRNTLSYIGLNQRIPKKCGMSSARVGWARLAHPNASSWMKEASGKMKFGRIIVRNAVLNYCFRASEHIPGNWNDEMVLQEEFITAWWRMTDFRVRKSWVKSSGV